MPDHYASRTVQREDFDLLGRLYDAEVASLDDAVGDLVDALAADGRLDDTIVIITSDHGENIGDHGHFGHVLSVHNTLLHVPLLVVLPGDDAPRGLVRQDVADLIDLFPTLLDRCGIRYAGPSHGRNLFAAGAESSTTQVMAEYYYPSQVFNVIGPAALRQRPDEFRPHMRRVRALQDGTTKVIWAPTVATSSTTSRGIRGSW